MSEARSHSVGVALLAAGSGSRFGGGKLLAAFRGVPLYRLAMDKIPEECARVSVVSGTEEILVEAKTRGFLPILNNRPEDGISRSIRLALKTLSDCDAVLFLTADQPLLRRETVGRILSASARHPAHIIVPVRENGEYGNPCLFPAAYFDALRALTGDRGGRRVISAHPESVFTVPVADAELADADTREALDALARE